MEKGKIVQLGNGEDIYREPNSRYVADFIVEVNLIDCVVGDDGKLRLTLGAAALPYEAPNLSVGQATLMIRPEAIGVTTDTSDRGRRERDLASLVCTVQDKVFVGPSLRICATLETGQEIGVQPEFTIASEKAKPGDKIGISWERDRARVLQC